MSFASGANATSIKLKAGDYGATDVACNDQPNATTISFDGRSFSYAHATRCTDTITKRSTGGMRITETCRAAGDGSPAKPTTQSFELRQKGAARFTLIKNGSAMPYRRCGPIGYFNTH